MQSCSRAIVNLKLLKEETDMAKKSPYTLAIPPNISRENLINALTKILPSAYAHRYGGDQITDEQARNLAIQLIDYAIRCEDAGQLRDVANRINLIKPTPIQCTDFKNWLDQLVQIHPSNPDRYQRSQSQIFVGKVWGKIKEDWLGLKEKIEYIPSAGAPRG